MVKVSRADKVLAKSFHEAYGEHGNGVQIDMMDMGKIKNEAITAAKAGKPMGEAVKETLAKYRKN